MLDAARRLSSVRILQEAFGICKRKDAVLQKQAMIVGKMLCLLFFSFRYELHSTKADPEIELAK
jgi:hypothetical protein